MADTHGDPAGGRRAQTRERVDVVVKGDDAPSAEWDGRTMTVRLPDPRRRRVMEAKWDVNRTSVARIREVGTDQWSVGFETPFRCCRFVGLKPDTAYEVEVRFRTSAGEGEPAIVRIHTGPQGASSSNVVPFPRR